MKKIILATLLLSSFAQAGIRMDCSLSEKSFKDGPPQKLYVEYSDQWYFKANGQNVATFELAQMGKEIIVGYSDYNSQRDLVSADIRLVCATSAGGYAEWNTKYINSYNPSQGTAFYSCTCAQ